MADYLDPVVAVFRADTADAIAKIEEFKLALDSIGNRTRRVDTGAENIGTRMSADIRRGVTDAERELAKLQADHDRTVQRISTGWDAWLKRMDTLLPETTQRWGKSLDEFKTRNADAASTMEGDFRKAFKNIVDSDANKAFRDIVAAADKAGKDSGDSFMARFKAALAEGERGGGGGGGLLSGILPGGRSASNRASALVTGLGLTLGPGLLSGAAYPLVAAAEAAAPGIVGTGAMLPFLKDAAGEVTKAFGALQTQQDKYNAAAQITANYLANDAGAMSNLKTLMGQVNPLQQQGLLVLNNQNASWASLTTTQQNGIISLRETAGVYKALTQSQKDQVNALLAQRNAMANLEPAQQQALIQYTHMHDVYDQLRSLSMPSMFTMIASAERAVADAMAPLLPLIEATAGAWTHLFNGLDNWLKGPEYHQFIADMTGAAPMSIEGFGKALGNIALGFLRIGDALSPMAGPFLAWLDHATAKFAEWATTPAGMTHLEHFMSDLEMNGPPVWRTLDNLAKTLGVLVGDLSGNALAWTMLSGISGALYDMSKFLPGEVVQILAMAVAFSKLAEALKLTAIASAALKAAGFGSAGASAGQAAAGAAGAAGAGEGAAAGGGAALLSRIGLTSGPAAILAGLVAMGTALTLYQNGVRRASDQAAGVIRNSGGQFLAASQVGGQQVSQAFKNMVDQMAASERQQALVATQTEVNAVGQQKAGFDYRQALEKVDSDVKNAMALGRTQFDQQTALFVNSWGGNIATMGAEVRKSGHTVEQIVGTTLLNIFTTMEQQLGQHWTSLGSTSNRVSAQTFLAMEQHAKQDYLSLQQAMQTYEDDLKHGRQAKAQQDSIALQQAMQRFMTDANNHVIDTSNTQISKLGKDLSAFLQAATKGDSAAAQKDLNALGQDVSGSFTTNTALMEARAKLAMTIGLKAYDQMVQTLGQNTVVPGRGGGSANPVKKAVGGWIAGPGSGTSDSIPALLSHGEFVVNAASAAQHRQLLEAINAPKFAAGGYAGLMGGPMDAFGSASGTAVLLYQQKLKQLAQAAQAAAAAASGGTNNSGGFSGHAVGPEQQYAASQLGRFGWGPNQLGPLIKLWNQESGWNPYAVNPSSGAYGIPQALGHGHPYNLGDYKAQINWGLSYIAGRYGSPASAWNHEVAYNWYDAGGLVKPGMTGVMNGTGQPEALLTHAQWSALAQLAAQGGGGGNITLVVNMDGREVFRSTRAAGHRNQFRNGKSTLVYDH